MCSPARCSTCNKVTWRGCGMHVDAVMAQFPVSERCTCRETQSRTPTPQR
ncbi:MAG: hypothetical protein BWY91_01853 [bacterium ADurb.BinA028]|jgi:hypothetical protein|nr:MAG: hypothetical protein BWY91_01853 [bacterium ADurb.BinA028]